MMSLTLAEKRVNDFKHKYGEVALQLAYHAALPVALNADLLHLLRINFFLDPPKSLLYTAEFELLLSPLCREIDEGLYEIEPEIRDILLQGLCSIDRGQRIKDVATLLWQYIDRDAVWIDRVELERAQQLTVLNFLNPVEAGDWLAKVKQEIDTGENVERDWYIAMQQEIDRHPQVIKKVPEEIDRAEEIRQNFYSQMLERHLDLLDEKIIEEFISHGYKLSFGLHPREVDELNIDELNINNVTNINITSVSKSVETDDLSAIFEVSAEIVFSAEFTVDDHEGAIGKVHQDTGNSIIKRLIPNQSIKATVRIYASILDHKDDELEIDHIDLVIQEPILVNYQDTIFSESSDSENIHVDVSKSQRPQTLDFSVSEAENSQDVFSEKSNIAIYHRFESNSQTVEIAKYQEKSLEILGEVDHRNPYASTIPKVKAYRGLLDEGKRGIEFTTNIPPDSFHPKFAYWSGDREELTIQGDFAILKVLTVKNFQKQVKISNPKQIRQLIENAVSDDDLSNLCIDEFPRVYNQFTQGQTRSQRIRSLVEYATQQNKFNKLLSAIEHINPTAYHDFTINNPPQDLQENLSSQIDEIGAEAQELLMTAFASSDNIFVFKGTKFKLGQIMINSDNFVTSLESLEKYRYAIAQLVARNFIVKLDDKTGYICYELAPQGYEFCIEAAKSPQPDAKSPTDLNTMPVSKTSTVGKSAPAAKTTRSKKQPDAAKLRKIQEHISILRNSRSTDLEKINALKALGRAIDNEQAIQAILFLTRTNKNNDVIAEAVKSLGNIGKKDPNVLQEMLRLLRSSSNNLVIIEVLTSLGKIGNTDSTTVRAVLNLLTFNKNGSVIINIMKTFALIAKGNNEVIQKTLSLLPIENDTNVRKSIIETLGEIASGNKSAISQLISTLSLSRDLSNLKQAAANSLGAIAVGDREVISAMERRLSTEQNKSVTDRISVNLNKIDPGNKAAAAYRLKMKKTRSTKK
jgi:hypothetical protein